MKDKLNQFVANLNGQWVEVSDKTNNSQCMDLVYNWIFALGFPKSTIQHLYAYEAYTLASDYTRQYFDVIENKTETIPQEGDIVVWNKTSGNGAGHIAIVIEATQSKMKVFEQNKPLGSNAHIADEGYNNCLGFLRPRIKDEVGIPQYLKVLAQESGIDINNESQVRSFWEKGKKYDDDIRSYQEKVKSANEALADRASEVSLLTEKNQKLSDEKAEAEEITNKLRSDKDTLIYEKAQLEVKVEGLVVENTDLQERVTKLESKNPLSSYSKWERFLSLFK